MIDRIKKDKNLTDDDKKMLFDSYPITQGAMENAPTFSSAVTYDYTLPNQKTIDLMPLKRNKIVRSYNAVEGVSDAFNTLAGSETSDDLAARDAQVSLGQAISRNEASDRASYDVSKKIEAIKEQETQKIQTTPPAPETSGAALQKQTLDIKAPQQPTAPTNKTGTTIVNNINAAPTPSGGGSISMGAGSSANYTGAIQPDSDSTYAYLVQDMSVPVIAGGNSI
jgi:hypothetical protein